MIALSFVSFLLVFILIGVSSMFQKKSNSSDYLLASQSVKPWLVGLSAVSTNNSGYMFIGMIGFSYLYGISSVWLMGGMIFGDFLASLLIHKKLRSISSEQKVLSFSGIISNWYGKKRKKLRFISGVFVVIFLTSYASAQLSAGSKALYVLFDLDYSFGIVIGALIVLLYCFAGGIRASIWTNTAQSFVMIFAMLLILYTAIEKIGGISDFNLALQNVNSEFYLLFPQNLPFGLFGSVLFVLGWIGGGIGVVGQPHIMLAFMTMEKADDIKKVRFYYYSWYVLFSFFTITTGLAARILIPELADFDPELAMPKMAQDLLPEVLIGLVLAGLFAATMSTADSQIISCTAALTNDITNKKSYIAVKFATVLTTFVAVIIALFGFESVFKLALVAWSSLASVFAPLLIYYVLGKKISENQSIAIMLSGFFGMLIWYNLGFGLFIYEAAIGIISGLISYPVVKRIMK